MELEEVIRKRRSIRKFKDKSVPEEYIDLLIEAGRRAPSGGNSQNWLFGLVTEKEKIHELSEAAGGQEWISQAPLIIAFCTELKKDFRELSEEDFELQVDKERFGEELIEHLKEFPNQRKVALLFENCNPLLPGEHIFLKAVDLGLGACWVGYLDIEKASSVLDLPLRYKCFFLMPIGYPDEEPVEKDLKGKEEITFKNSYQLDR